MVLTRLCHLSVKNNLQRCILLLEIMYELTIHSLGLLTLHTQLWVLDYVKEEDELRRRKSSSRRSMALSESDFDPGIHGDRHLPVVQNLKRSASPPPLVDIKEGMNLLFVCIFLMIISIGCLWFNTTMRYITLVVWFK